MELVYPNERRLFAAAAVVSGLFWAVIVLGTLGIALIYGLLGLIIAIFVQAAFISHVKGSGVLVNREQYPDLYERLETCCRTVGLDRTPDTYLLRTDFFNALATRFLRRHYIVLFTDVVDALQDRPGAINFYIGHELGHIHRNHIRWGWFLFPALFMPLLGSAYRRAEEYTCDRYGSACCQDDTDATAALAAIAAGNTRWQSMNVPAYLRQTESTGGFWMSLNELLSDYPWLSKRMAWVVALRHGSAPTLPRRHPLAWLLSALVPRMPGGGGAASALVVIAVVGILAAVALPAYQDYVKHAKEAAAAQVQPRAEDVQPQAEDGAVSARTLLAVQDELEGLRHRIDAHYAQHGALPGSLPELGFAKDVLYSENGGMPIGVYQDGVIAVYLGAAEAGDMFFVNQPQHVEQTGQTGLTWTCFGQNVPATSLPAGCR